MYWYRQYTYLNHTKSKHSFAQSTCHSLSSSSSSSPSSPSSLSSSSCSVLLPRVGCNGPPFLAVLCLSDCLVVLQSCPFSDVCCLLCYWSSASSRAIHLSIQNCVSLSVTPIKFYLKLPPGNLNWNLKTVLL